MSPLKTLFYSLCVVLCHAAPTSTEFTGGLELLQPPDERFAYSLTPSAKYPIRVVFAFLRIHFPAPWVEKISRSYRRSETSVERLLDDFFRLKLYHPVFRKEPGAYIAAKRLTAKLFNLDGFSYRPVHFTDTRRYPWNLATSAEYPFAHDQELKKRVHVLAQAGLLPHHRLTKGNLYNMIYRITRTQVHQIKDGVLNTDNFHTEMTAHARSHIVEVDAEDKIRMVYGVMMLYLIVELMLLWPLFQHIRVNNTPILWGYEIMCGGLYRLSHKFCPSLTYVMADWSAFDKTVPFNVIDDVHHMWRKCLIPDKGYIPTLNYPHTTTKPRRINRLWNWMCWQAKYCPIRLPDGSLWRRCSRGVASGFMQTQVLDSFINTIMILTILLTMGVTLDFDGNDFIFVLGDDSLTGISETIRDPQRFKEVFASHAYTLFGMTAKPEKTKITDSPNEIELLGYQFRNGLPVRNIDKLVASLLHPEHRQSASHLKARALGYAYAAVGMSRSLHMAMKGLFLRFKDETFKYWQSDTLKQIFEYTGTVPEKFPSIEEVQSQLYRPTRPDVNDDVFWPSWWFLSHM